MQGSSQSKLRGVKIDYYSGTSDKDTLNKGHLCMKDTFQCTNQYIFASERGQPL